MAEVFFYHMTLHPLDVTLPMLLEKSLKAGWRVGVLGSEQSDLERLDKKLWEREGFLPHGLAGAPFDGDQSILLSANPIFANHPDCIVAIDGSDLDVEIVQKLSRTMILFDGQNPDAVAHARSQWKQVTAAQVPAKYWSQESGRWEMKAQYPSPT